ncbi:hypothetical protein M9Y10_025313 [Tritrichomonas musculus]|uniref:Uncharacterized protein n=1 Tax=Tritrichomonas musculus TaxID=1915356 RepID=A0ABR2GKL1_9EUKA
MIITKQSENNYNISVNKSDENGERLIEFVIESITYNLNDEIVLKSLLNDYYNKTESDNKYLAKNDNGGYTINSDNSIHSSRSLEVYNTKNGTTSADLILGLDSSNYLALSYSKDSANLYHGTKPIFNFRNLNDETKNFIMMNYTLHLMGRANTMIKVFSLTNNSKILFGKGSTECSILDYNKTDTNYTLDVKLDDTQKMLTLNKTLDSTKYSIDLHKDTTINGSLTINSTNDIPLTVYNTNSESKNCDIICGLNNDKKFAFQYKDGDNFSDLYIRINSVGFFDLRKYHKW